MASLRCLLLVCHVIPLVSAVLLPPTNLQLISQNFQHILTWDDPNNAAAATYYKVYWQRDSKPPASSKSCSNITIRHCDLTKDFTDIMAQYTAIVQIFTDDKVSPIATAREFSPALHTSLGPPLVDVVPCFDCIKVSILPPVSHLWSETEQSNVTMSSNEVYPFLEYTIQYRHMAESPHTIQSSDLENITVLQKLLPNTNYCVSVEVKAGFNIAPSIPSAEKCVVTGPNSVSQDHVGRMEVIVPVVCGLLLFVGILLMLFALDRAGYIGMRMKFLPKVLKSLPRIESGYSEGNEGTTTVHITPVEIICQNREEKKSQENENKYKEGGYTVRKNLMDSDTSGEDSSGPLLSANSSSFESSGQMTGSSDEDQNSTEHQIDLGIITDSAQSFPPIAANISESSSDLSFNNSMFFNINLTSICIGNSADTGLKNGEEPEGGPDTDSGRAGLLLNGDFIGCTSDVLVDLEPAPVEYDSDNYEEDLSDNGGDCYPDDHVVSGYMSR